MLWIHPRIRRDSWKAAAYIKLCQYLQLIMEHLWYHEARVVDIVTVKGELDWILHKMNYWW